LNPSADLNRLPRDFIAKHTLVTAPALCPELKLYLASEITPLWHATETYLEENNIPPPYWAFPWAGGQALTRYVLDHPDLVAGKHVLDFAAGSGMSAVAAALGGAAQVDANEIDPISATVMGMNADLNEVKLNIVIRDLTGEDACPWDVVIAGDVCYERPMAERIFPWLKRLAKQGATVLLADPGRAYLPSTGLMKLASYIVPTSLELEDRTSRETLVYQIVG